jgi:hypothetical protein
MWSIVRINHCGSPSIAAKKRRLSLSASFGNTYAIEISQATNFVANIRSMVTYWISIVPTQSWPSNWTAEDTTTVRVKFTIEHGRNSWIGMESLCCDSGIIRFAKSLTACCERSGSHSSSHRKTIPHLHPLPLGKGEARFTSHLPMTNTACSNRAAEAGLKFGRWMPDAL